MIRLLALVILALAFGTQSPASADKTKPGAGPNGFFVAAERTIDAASPPRSAQPAATKPAESNAVQIRYALRNPCGVSIDAGAPICPQNTCAAGEEIYRLVAISNAGESPQGLTCVGDSVPANVAAPPPPQVTGAMVLAAFRRVPLPELRSQSQPADKTLVNFDTIFFTEAEPLTRTVTILGQTVRLEIEPSRFTWQHGDGTSTTTTGPGAPYPAKDVVHRYADAHVTVAHRVVVTWTAEWSLNGGPLQPVDGTVTTTGPATPLRVAEASPSLSGQR